MIPPRKASHTSRGGLVYTSTQTQTRVLMCSSMSEGIDDGSLKEEELADTKSSSLDGAVSAVTLPFFQRAWKCLGGGAGPQCDFCDGGNSEAYADS